MMNLNHKAFSLIEVMIAIGMISLLAVLTLSIFENQNKSSQFLEFKVKRVQLQTTLLNQFLNDPVNCQCLFKGAAEFPVEGVAQLSGVAPSLLGRFDFTTVGDCSTATVPSPYVTDGTPILPSGSSNIIDGLLMNSVQLQEIKKISGLYTGKFVVNLQSHKLANGPNILSIKIPVSISTSAGSPGQVVFNSCWASKSVLEENLSGGYLCGFHSSIGGATLLCGGLNPAVSCPAGFYKASICDDNGAACSQNHYTCVSTAQVMVIPSGSLCGFKNSTVTGAYLSDPSLPTALTSYTCDGSNLPFCPGSHAQQVICDDNGAGCSQTIDFCSSLATTSTADLKPGTLCGLHSTSKSFAGKFSGISDTILCQGKNPLTQCPNGFSQKIFCDDNASGCGQAYFTCSKN